MVWTTTPWTIPVNQAIAYNQNIKYALVDVGHNAGVVGMADLSAALSNHPLRNLWEKQFIIAADLVGAFEQRLKASLQSISAPLQGGSTYGVWTNVIREFDGVDLAGSYVLHPMAATNPESPFFAKRRKVISAGFVTTDTGTGLVHMSPDHGEDDFDLCKANGIDPVFAVEGDGKYRADWGWLGGQGSVINAKFNAPDGPICSDLREAGGLLAALADYKHSYPHSWRSKAKVIYRCTPQWFIAMDRPLPDDHCETFAEKRWDNEGGALGHGPTLRQLAMRAIGDTRWVPEKGRNRITAMVEGRPDWVISRQRAWGVPIALFVERESGQPLVDTEVNSRIVAAIKAEGVDAWSDERAGEFLGADRDPADYERVTDILDVWFDSGCTHVFTLESGAWPDQSWPADLYLEGSDQHRGWFQSSLLESCGTRGRAPYNAVLTHGFTMDAKGMKMSKSLGNTINPLDLMRDTGADILRLWALSVDFTEDHRIGKEILAGVSDQYRKLRNTFRYLLGALDGFDESERVTDVAAMPELERYMLSLLARLDATMRQAVADYDFNTYVRALADFANEDLSAFFFDIRKDSLYCDAATDPKRRAYRSVLDTLFHALARWAAPVLVFTSEEVWGTRFPDAGSVHLLEWPILPSHPNEGRGPPSDKTEEKVDPHFRGDDDLVAKWNSLRALRAEVTEAIEPLRRDKKIRSSLEAEIAIPNAKLHDEKLLEELFISSTVRASEKLQISKTTHLKCGRCWRHLPEVVEDGDLCTRCEGVVNA